jgi:hypothetical protein
MNLRPPSADSSQEVYIAPLTARARHNLPTDRDLSFVKDQSHFELQHLRSRDALA